MQQPDPGTLAAGPDKKPALDLMDVVEAAKDINPSPYSWKVYWCISQDHPIRKVCIKILEWPWFDRIIMFLILISSILMAAFQEPILSHMQSELDGELNRTIGCGMGGIPGNSLYDLNTWYQNRVETVEKGLDWFFLSCFIIEMLIKLIAQGLFLESGSYLRSPWNWLDGIVVISGLLIATEALGGGGGVQVLRLFRLLRPLRALQRVRGMRVLVQCILGAIPQMCRVFLVLVLLILVLGIIGVQLFASKLRHACWIVDDDGTPLESTGYTCDPHCYFGEHWDTKTQQIIKPCDSLGANTLLERNVKYPWSWTCQGPNQQCLCAESAADDPYCTWLDNPNYGVNSFDNILSAMMTIFQSITLEGWVDVMYALQDGLSPLTATVYSIAIVLLGALIVMNLFLAVLADNFAMADSEADAKDVVVIRVTPLTKENKKEVREVLEGEKNVATVKPDVAAGVVTVKGESVKPDDLIDALHLHMGIKGEEVLEEEEQSLEDAQKEIKHTSALRRKAHEIIREPRFDKIIIGCIIVNTLLMCCDYYPPKPDTFGDDLEATGFKAPGFFWTLFTLNLILTMVFTVETILKLLGYGPRIFVKDSFNVFDAVVVLISVVEVLLEVLEKSGAISLDGFPGAMSALRALRVFRVLKMVRSVKSLRLILSALVRSLNSVVYLAMLLLLFIFIFALLGMEFFGGFMPYPLTVRNFTEENFPCAFQEWNIRWSDDYARFNFDRFGDAFLSIFVVLSGENWNDIYFNQHRATWHQYFPTATVYFVCLFVVGNLLLFNLFIAILISNMEGDEEEEEEEEKEEKEELAKAPKMSYAFGRYNMAASEGAVPHNPDRASSNLNRSLTTGLENLEPKKATPAQRLAEAEADGAAGGGRPDKSLCLFGWDNPVRRVCALVVWHRHFDTVVLVMIIISSTLLLFDWPGYSNDHISKVILDGCNIFFTILFSIECLLKIVVYGFVYSRHKSKDFPAYLRVGWNQLDFLVVLISIFSLISSNVPALKAIPASALRAVRALRALRPLRLIARLENMRIVVNTLLATCPAVGVFAMVFFLFVLIFAILFMQMFGGKLGYCLDPMFDGGSYGSRVIPGKSDQFKTDYDECMALPKYYLNRYNTLGVPLHDPIFACKKITDPSGCAPLDHTMFVGEGYLLKTDAGKDYRVGDDNPYYAGKNGYELYAKFPQWVNPDFGHFDNVFAAIHLLIEVACLEGWPDVMTYVMDTDLMGHYIVPYWIKTYEDPDVPWEIRSGKVDGNWHVTNEYIGAAFFIVWVVLGCFVLLNMVIGVVLDSFNSIKAEQDGLTMMTEAQGEWVKAQKTIMAMRPLKQPKPPTQAWRMPFFRLVNSNPFEIAILCIIVLNMFFMCINTWDPSATDTNILDLYEVGRVANIIFFTLYTVEMFIKWTGLGVKQYFSDTWNAFDFVLVILSAIDIYMSDSDGQLPFPPAVLRVVRMFRVVRILRILKTAKNLRTIITTIRISIPALSNIACLLGIILAIYAIICMNFFFMVNYTPGDIGPPHGGPYNTSGDALTGDIIWKASWTEHPWHVGDNSVYTAFWADPASGLANTTMPVAQDGEVATGPYYFSNGNSNQGDFLNRHANFRYIMGSIITLFRCATGESFNGIMHDLMAPDWGTNMLRCCPTCGPQINWDEKVPGSCGPIEGILPGGVAAIIFWSYTLLMGFIILNGLFIGVIVDNFTNIGSENKSITVENIEEFREVWLRFDPKGTFAIPAHSLLVILQQLRAPLGVSEKTLTRSEMLSLLARLDIPDHDGQIHFQEVLTALAHNECGQSLPICSTTKRLQRQVEKRLGMKGLKRPVANALTSYLITSMQARWRGYMKTTGEQLPAGPDTDVTNLPPLSSSKIKPNQVAPVS